MTDASENRLRRKQQRGLRTQARLIAAAKQVVAEVGYPRATTKRIAEVAGVSEGTIYRHFPDKHHLFYAAALDDHHDALTAFERLSERAGTATIEANLRPVLERLAGMRRDLLPLELWMLANPELRREARRSQARRAPEEPLIRYLAAEQREGRLASSLDLEMTALTMLATLFGVAVLPASDDAATYRRLVDHAITVLVAGTLMLGDPPDR